MTIFVDPLGSFGWKMRGRVVQNCHMFTDVVDIEELHTFAEQIGMKRAWFQPHHITPHYDLTPNRREAALMRGAVAVSRRDAVEIWRRRRMIAEVVSRM
jgi:hypothetical protein